MKRRYSEISLAIRHNFGQSKTQPGNLATVHIHNSGTCYNSYLDYLTRKTNSSFEKLD